ncbi:Alpha/Beta hydrolase protein [Hypoxylon rubiginosum]|uniref:Alpha/Beta hydrolase protein n=1 Tax=Hypoxylon rubiginosum TaxID=110542 RepID=A0ACC0CQC8_9PEZI|nr:Alpha/Beta hydrolase protein [Hypoxylon rubiginosum]
MSIHEITEGEVAFAAPNAGKPCSTWFKTVGDLQTSSARPLIALHGGPGAGHNYLVSLTDLTSQYGIPLVLYDQIGCGRSTHFREKMGDDSFWTFDLFIAELDNLVDHLQLREKGFYVLGQSWGGMLAGMYAARRPKGLLKVVIGGAPCSFPLFVEGGKRQRAQLPLEIRKDLEKDPESPEYKRASEYFYKKHVCNVDPMPAPVQATFKNLEDDPTAYNTMQGPSELIVTGNLKDWDGSEEAKNIEVDALLVNGRDDEVSDLTVEPWFRSIPRVKWVTFERSSHMPHWEERERFMELVGTFLTKY